MAFEPDWPSRPTAHAVPHRCTRASLNIGLRATLTTGPLCTHNAARRCTRALQNTGLRAKQHTPCSTQMHQGITEHWPQSQAAHTMQHSDAPGHQQRTQHTRRAIPFRLSSMHNPIVQYSQCSRWHSSSNLKTAKTSHSGGSHLHTPAVQPTPRCSSASRSGPSSTRRSLIRAVQNALQAHAGAQYRRQPEGESFRRQTGTASMQHRCSQHSSPNQHQPEQPGRGILLNTKRFQESNHRRAHCATPGRPYFCASEHESCFMLHGEAPGLWCPAARTPDRSTSSACEGTPSLASPTEAGSTHAAELHPQVYTPRGLCMSKCTKKPRYR